MSLNYIDIPQKPIPTCYVEPKDVPGIKPGDHLANSKREGFEVVADGGIDFHQAGVCQGSQVKRIREQGRFLIKSEGRLYRYVLRAQPQGGAS